ncbi:hypothetical protein [Aeromonas sp. R2-2]|uniref:hypothetical protein n=1 Tax=Aeromonas sp. R2-2 TaxID=3138460 RepID=UPI0034A2292B
MTVTTADLGLGPAGLGYCYNIFTVANMIADPSIKFTSSEVQLFVGSQLDATYTGFTLSPGMQDVTSVSWNGGPFIPVVAPGVVPPYVIKQADIGKPVTLKVRYKESDKNGIDSVHKDVEYTTGNFLSGIVLER